MCGWYSKFKLNFSQNPKRRSKYFSKKCGVVVGVFGLGPKGRGLDSLRCVLKPLITLGVLGAHMCHVWPPPNDENPKLITFFLKYCFLYHTTKWCAPFGVSGAGNPKDDRATTKKEKLP